MEKINESKTLMERKGLLTSQVTTNMHEERMMEKEIRCLGETIRGLILEVEELNMIEDPEPVDVLVLEEECIKISKHLDTLTEKYRIHNQEKKEIESEVKTAEEDFRGKEIKLRELSGKLETFREDHASAQTEYDEAKSHHSHYEKKKKEQERKIDDINKQCAEIIIHLSNEGPDAYKSENYGNRIVIERKFSKDGASSYRIKSSSGHVVSNKREELRNILDYFNILVDNPVVILNQEVSRNFLHSKNPTDKYRFFLQATQLGQIQADYAEVKLQKNSAKEILSKKEESFPALESEVKEWKKKYKAFTALENQKEKIKNLKSEMAWSLVIEKEESLKPQLNAKRAEEARTPKFERMVVESTTKLLKAKSKMDEMSEQSKTLETDETFLLPELKAGKQQLISCKNKLRAKQADLKKLGMNIKNGVQDKDKIKERINEIKNSSMQLDYEAEKRRREERIQALKEKVEAIKQQKHAKDVEKDLYHNAVMKYKNDVYRVDMEMRNLKTAIEDNQRELNKLRSATMKNQ